MVPITKAPLAETTFVREVLNAVHKSNNQESEGKNMIWIRPEPRGQSYLEETGYGRAVECGRCTDR